MKVVSPDRLYLRNSSVIGTLGSIVHVRFYARFASTLGERVNAASTAASNGDSLGALQNLAAPLRSKHPEVYGHLIAAGGELLAAYRAAVSASEKRWTAEKPSSSEQIDLD